MLKNMDFILHVDEDKIIKLRFYPKHSSLHLFDCGFEKKPSERNFALYLMMLVQFRRFLICQQIAAW